MQAAYERRLIIQEIIENLLRALAELVMLAGENVGHLIRNYLEAQINNALNRIEGKIDGWEKYGERYLNGGHKRRNAEASKGDSILLRSLENTLSVLRSRKDRAEVQNKYSRCDTRSAFEGSATER